MRTVMKDFEILTENLAREVLLSVKIILKF